jgi:hypothetical protein
MGIFSIEALEHCEFVEEEGVTVWITELIILAYFAEEISATVFQLLKPTADIRALLHGNYLRS